MFTPPELLTWINGEPEVSEIEDGSHVVNPNTGEVMQASRSSSKEQVDRAIQAATDAHEDGRWRSKTADERADYLMRFAEELEKDGDNIALADAYNSGAPLQVTRGFASGVADVVRDVAERIRVRGDSEAAQAGERTVIKTRVPWGPAALILPWNAPVFMIVKKLAYALASGSTTVIKPSSFSPWSAQFVMQAAERAGFPAGSVNLVTGSGGIGRQLVSDPRIRSISMTGSTQTGRSIAKDAGANLTRLQLELGSNNPAIVRADADLSLAADQLTSGFTKLSGQWCEAPRRVYVQESVYNDLLQELKARLDSVRIGSSVDDTSEIGPVAFAERKQELEAQLADLVDQGAEVYRKDLPQELSDGNFFAPAIVYGNGLLLNEEVFGPMLTVVPYTDESQAVRDSNSGSHGLAGYIFTADEDAGWAIASQLEAGEIKLNGTSVLDMADDSAQGFFASSGIGGHGNSDVLEFFTGWRIVGTDAEGLPI